MFRELTKVLQVRCCGQRPIDRLATVGPAFSRATTPGGRAIILLATALGQSINRLPCRAIGILMGKLIAHRTATDPAHPAASTPVM